MKTLTQVANCDSIYFNEEGNGEDALQIIEIISQNFYFMHMSIIQIIENRDLLKKKVKVISHKS